MREAYIRLSLLHL